MPTGIQAKKNPSGEIYPSLERLRLKKDAIRYSSCAALGPKNGFHP